MDIDIFSKLTISRQAQYTWKHGSHLARKDGFRYHHDLYALNDFFVEIIYNLELGQVDKIEGFIQTARLNPYIEDISLNQLY
ncbi:hypothetical protein OKW21_002445 [Catalinimonas alkaloidigena]|uniref:hypothetical protein n=1 Tax=Catalinimonas alkaloidigena TaxID=1075417 RepID=UPI002404DE1C|nr:hypothetical protein [Catalinimonas alkaloidigena]MDF9797182.1 hypothetical protein [Catalinimonas alkaloidigena]